MKTTDVYSVIFFKNPAWGLRSPHNRMEFQKALVAVDYESAEILAKEFFGGIPYQVFKRKKDQRVVVHFESNSLLVKIVKARPVEKREKPIRNPNHESSREAAMSH